MIPPRKLSRRVVAGGVVLLALIVTAVLYAVRWHGATGSAPAGQPGSATRAGAMAGMDMGGSPTSANRSVRLTAGQLRQFGITFGTVEMRPLENRIRTAGTVTPDETKLAQVVPKVGGYVERLYVDYTGQSVRRGQPLLELYSPELLAAEQELLVAAGVERSVGQSAIPGVPSSSPGLLQAARRRLELWDISDAQIDEILRTGTVRRTLTLYAPVTGIVLEKHVVQGQAVEPGQMLYAMANLADVWVEAALREQDAGAVRVGSEASVTLAAFPGHPFAGRVTYIYPTLDSASRTLRARIEVPNPDGRLKPGMYATVELTTPTRAALSVPASAVVNTGERTLVFVDVGHGDLAPREVMVGRVAGGYAEVLSGLEPGQRVVTSAQFLLDSESNLAEVMKSMIGQMNTSDLNDTGSMQEMPGMNMPSDKGADVKGAMQGMPMPASPDSSRR